MISFKQFMEDGSAPTVVTAGVSGAGDNPDKTVPVSKKKQKTYQQRGADSEKELVRQLRKITSVVNA